MLTSYDHTVFPAPSSTFTPALLTVQDMVNTRITYVAYRPYQRPVIQQSGTVLQVRQYRNTLYLQVQPDEKRAPRWVSEFDFVRYC